MANNTENTMAKWVFGSNNKEYPSCSNCGYMPPYEHAIDDILYTNYCPECGKEMRNGQSYWIRRRFK